MKVSLLCEYKHLLDTFLHPLIPPVCTACLLEDFLGHKKISAEQRKHTRNK